MDATELRLDWWQSKRVGERIWLAFVYTVLIIGSLAMLLPGY